MIPLSVWFFRFDDTNPEAEKKEDINHIEEIVNWMGWAPFKVFLLLSTNNRLLLLLLLLCVFMLI